MTAASDSSLPEQDLLSEDDFIKIMDEHFIFMMRFTKKLILEESIHNTVITPPQFGLLYQLSRCGPRTMKELSEQMDLTHGATTGLVDRLHRLGLVRRDRDEQDRRVVNVQVTETGEELISRIERRRHHILRKIVQELSPEERKLLLKIERLTKDKLMNYVE